MNHTTTSSLDIIFLIYILTNSYFLFTLSRDNKESEKELAEEDAKSIEEVIISEKTGIDSKGSRVKKDRADRKREAKTRTWSDVVKVLEIEDELETTNSDKSGNGSEKSDLVEPFDSQEPNQLKVKRSKRHQKNQGKVKWSTRALREDKPTEKVETHGIGGVKKRWTGGVEEQVTRNRTGPDEEHEQGVETRGRFGFDSRRTSSRA